jgi:hypothetical protein
LIDTFQDQGRRFRRVPECSRHSVRGDGIDHRHSLVRKQPHRINWQLSLRGSRLCLTPIRKG